MKKIVIEGCQSCDRRINLKSRQSFCAEFLFALPDDWCNNPKWVDPDCRLPDNTEKVIDQISS
jgi:hypothetical protein